MDYKRIIEFLVNAVFNVVVLAITVILIFNVTGKSFESGKEILQDYTKELPEQEITVDINEGATLAEVSVLLEKEGVIKSAFLFRAENILKGNSESFGGGTFLLNTEMDAGDIVNTLRKKNYYSTDIVITIKEGFTVKNIGELLESKGLFTADAFIEACNNSEFDFEFLKDIPERENRLEGYLFPDTYYIAENSSPETVIRKLLTRFDEIYSKYKPYAEQKGITMDEAIIIASIIEKEVRIDEERPKVSQVIYNRLEQEINLQMCSTILYALDKRKDKLYENDLNVESPYNTYKNSGLPKGPISNPGEACIKAAVNPSEGNFLYFVIKDEDTGAHVFTADYNEFLSAKELYNQKF